MRRSSCVCVCFLLFRYNVLLSALSKSEAVAQCREVFEEAEAARGITPDRVTYETLIQAYVVL